MKKDSTMLLGILETEIFFGVLSRRPYSRVAVAAL